MDCIVETPSPLRKRERDENPNRRPDGTLIHPPDAVYIGEVDSDGYYTGFGQMTYPDGLTYVGDFLHGCGHGHGRLTFPNGNQCIGEFVNGEIHGKGTYTEADGTKLTGPFVCSKKHGAFQQFLPNEIIINVTCIANTPSKKVEIIYPDGTAIINEHMTQKTLESLKDYKTLPSK